MRRAGNAVRRRGKRWRGCPARCLTTLRALQWEDLALNPPHSCVRSPDDSFRSLASWCAGNKKPLRHAAPARHWRFPAVRDGRGGTWRTSAPVGPNNREAVSQFVSGFCVECHNNQDQGTGLDFEAIDCNNLSKNPIVWRKSSESCAARRCLRSAIRPSRRTYESILSELTDSLDRAAAIHPDPGRTETFRRLNRGEYQNAIRDLLAMMSMPLALAER